MTGVAEERCKTALAVAEEGSFASDEEEGSLKAEEREGTPLAGRSRTGRRVEGAVQAGTVRTGLEEEEEVRQGKVAGTERVGVGVGGSAAVGGGVAERVERSLGSLVEEGSRAFGEEGDQRDACLCCSCSLPSYFALLNLNCSRVGGRCWGLLGGTRGTRELYTCRLILSA